MKLQKIHKTSLGTRYETNSILYEIKLKLQKIDKKSNGNRYEITSIRQEINNIRYEIT